MTDVIETTCFLVNSLVNERNAKWCSSKCFASQSSGLTSQCSHTPALRRTKTIILKLSWSQSQQLSRGKHLMRLPERLIEHRIGRSSSDSSMKRKPIWHNKESQLSNWSKWIFMQDVECVPVCQTNKLNVSALSIVSPLMRSLSMTLHRSNDRKRRVKLVSEQPKSDVS